MHKKLMSRGDLHVPAANPGGNTFAEIFCLPTTIECKQQTSNRTLELFAVQSVTHHFKRPSTWLP